MPAPRRPRPFRTALVACALLLALLPALLAAGPVRGAEPAEPLLDTPAHPVRAHDFSARRLTGEPLRLNDLLGKVVFLNFWATWCVPCKAEMPAMERLAQTLADAPFVIVAVNMQEPPERVKAFVEELGLTFPVVLDPTGKISRAYATTVLPTTYVIDRNGYVVRRALGPRPWDKPHVVQLFRDLLGPYGPGPTAQAAGSSPVAGGGSVAK